MASRPTRSRRPPPKHRPEPQSMIPPANHHLEPQSRAKWTTSLTNILADLMVNQVNKGNRHNKSFDKKAWKYICEEFYKKTGLNWDKDQLKSRYSALRKQYVVTKCVLDEDDFKWDEPTGIIVASDEVWSKYIKEHPDAEFVRSTGCPIYKQLCTIFSEPGINGKHNGSAEHEEGTPGSIPCPQPLSTFQEEESSSDSEETADTTDEQDRFQSTTSRDIGRKRGRRGIDDVIASGYIRDGRCFKVEGCCYKEM